MANSSDHGMKNLKYDKRLLEWNLNNGLLSKEELKKHLDELPDLSSRVDLLRMGEERSQPEYGDTH